MQSFHGGFLLKVPISLQLPLKFFVWLREKNKSDKEAIITVMCSKRHQYLGMKKSFPAATVQIWGHFVMLFN